MAIRNLLDRFFTHRAPADPGDTLLVAFSGGPDSTALLEQLVPLAASRRWRLVAAHLDHRTDPASTDRARHAAEVARQLGVGWLAEARDVPGLRRSGESPEAAGRRLRYDFLERARLDADARWIVTGHHGNDQAETVLLRMLQGSGIEGLAGIRPVRGRVVRPLLGVLRAELDAVRTRNAVTDPANRDPRVPRSAVRHRLLPRLERARPGTTADLGRLAARAAGVGGRLRRTLDRVTPVAATPDGADVEAAGFLALPSELRAWLLAHLHRSAGARHPAGADARRELERQVSRLGLDGTGTIGCDAGDGWRWELLGGRLALRRDDEDAPSVTHDAGFTYTLSVPGEVAVPELALRLRLRTAPVAPWMFRGAPHRTGLRRPAGATGSVTLRTRRPGDRLRPLGAGGTRRLKDVLIDHKVPAAHRDRLPLLLVDGRIAWVPGVTVDDRFRVPEDGAGGDVWVAEILPPEPTESSPRGCG